ncbi:hypothetical protein BGW80DRAFT_1287590 [Lactifluus volemus]|nr:hypothetical protein BGW80DRAFT_1287590 [Lactifluus volemus]
MTPQAHPEYPVTLNSVIELETGQSQLSCPKCRSTFSSRGVRNRHMDDVHSVRQKCPHSGCKVMIKGKRALKRHLFVRHK